MQYNDDFKKLRKNYSFSFIKIQIGKIIFLRSLRPNLDKLINSLYLPYIPIKFTNEFFSVASGVGVKSRSRK
jgi:hypothetical protein